MTQERKLILGEKGDTLTSLAKEYLEVSAKVKELQEFEKRKELLAKSIKELCPYKDTFETVQYKIEIQSVKGRVTVDTKKLQEEHPKIYEKYATVGNDYLRIGKVEIKGEEA